MYFEQREQEVLGWMLQMMETFELQDKHFTQERHAIVFRAIEWCRANGGRWDEETVALALEERGELGFIGGRAYLSKLIQQCPSFAAGAFRAADIIKSEYAARLLRPRK